MRSVRMASGRRRGGAGGAGAGDDYEYVTFGAAPAPAPAPARAPAYSSLGGDAPLDPLWAALEQKLML